MRIPRNHRCPVCRLPAPATRWCRACFLLRLAVCAERQPDDARRDAALRALVRRATDKTCLLDLFRQVVEAGIMLEPLPDGRLRVTGPAAAEPIVRQILARKADVLDALAKLAKRGYPNAFGSRK